LVGFGFDACILSDAADQPPLILTTQGTLPMEEVFELLQKEAPFLFRLLLRYPVHYVKIGKRDLMTGHPGIYITHDKSWNNADFSDKVWRVLKEGFQHRLSKHGIAPSILVRKKVDRRVRQWMEQIKKAQDADTERTDGI
jgi:hypothetical protein